ncbi:MAG: ceramidase domain-containing protein [Rhodocyclaceae bacterium]|nr:ceramidase domain-containing protein [Rhodocyclaceae bacterium]
MSWRDPLDLYCERTDPGLWAEPVNALTNLAFLFAAAHLLRRMGPDTPAELRALGGLLGLIGVGSLIFHTVAQRWASVLDIVFIAIFVLLFVHCALRRLHGWGRVAASTAVIGVVVASALIALVARLPALNGSELYLGPWLTLIALAATCPQPVAARWLRAVSALFALSMLFRSADLALCETFPLGTHFGWHLNNALVLWCGMRGLLAGRSARL